MNRNQRHIHQTACGVVSITASATATLCLLAFGYAYDTDAPFAVLASIYGLGVVAFVTSVLSIVVGYAWDRT